MSRVLAFWRAAEGTGICLNWLRLQHIASILSMPGVTWNQRRMGWLAAVAPKKLQYCRQTPVKGKDYMLLKKKPASLCKWKITCISPDRFHFPQKVSDALRISSQIDWWRSPYTKPVHKEWERLLFFQIHRIQEKKNHKAHKETETWPKFRTLETNPNEMEIYDLTKN